MSQRQRGIAVQLDPAQRVEQRRAAFDRDVELVEVPVATLAAVAVHAQVTGLDGLLFGRVFKVRAMIVTPHADGGGVVGRVGKQHGLPGPAGLVDVELATDDVGAQLRHPAERRRLSAGDRDEALEAVGLLVVERLEGARQLTSAVPLAARTDERAGRRPGGTLLGVRGRPG